MALNNLPLSGQTLGVTRVPINQNFSTINSAFLVDHVEYSTTGAGKHNKVTFPVQSPAPTFASGEYGLYNLAYNNGVTTANELWIQKLMAEAPGSNQIPFSASKMSGSAYASCDNGWSYLPSGLLIKWGFSSAPSATVSITPTNTSGGPTFNRVFRVFVTPFDNSGNTNFNCGQKTVANNTTGNFDAYCANPTGTTAIRYLVLGV